MFYNIDTNRYGKTFWKQCILQSYFLKTTAAVRAICDLTIYLCAIIYINKTDAVCFNENGNKPFSLFMHLKMDFKRKTFDDSRKNSATKFIL